MSTGLRLNVILKSSFRINKRWYGPKTEIEIASHGRNKTKISIKGKQIIIPKKILEFKKILEKAC